uniref:FAD-binding PCMH-type domain-containing protein n=1 Tax=Glossina morsitans morsitans TaxID=37546 RepID=A0A1B0GDN7_GLOMM
MTTSFRINGNPYTVDLKSLPADVTLNTFIREHAQLTATKFMCLEGGCGVCVVTIKGKHPVTGELRTWAANSCLMLLSACMDYDIITCEGIGNKRDGYHPIQKRLAKLNGTQCGYCSPGFIMNMYSLVESKQGGLTMDEIENAFGGNICRCTGYRPILDTMKSFAVDSVIQLPSEYRDIEDLISNTCPKSNENCSGHCRRPMKSLLFNDGAEWFWPKTLEELFETLNKINTIDEYMLVGGNTAHGVYRRSENIKKFIDINAIPDLKKHSLTSDTLTLGANLTLSETMDIFMKASKKSGFEYCQQLWQHFDLIANVPVRNNGTLAGNISIKKMHPEFPSDIFITFEALDVQVVVNTSATKQQTMSLADYLSDNTPKLVISAFELKSYPKSRFIFKSYKIMPRAQNAHAYVNAGFLLDFDSTARQVNDARICFGGITPEFIHAEPIEKMLKTQCFYDKTVIEKTFSELPKILNPDAELTDASPEYRRKLACGLLFKYYLDSSPSDKVKEEFRSGGPILIRNLSSGIQSFESNKKNFPINQPVQKLEALIQCSGEATYMNDMLTHDNTVYCAFVTATKVNATIEQIDASEALKMPGVIAFFSAKDIPGTNTFVDQAFGYEVEEILCPDTVRYYDQPLGIIAAVNTNIANRAASKVRVIYSYDSDLVMPTMEDVFENEQLDRVYNVLPSSVKAIRLSDSAEITASGIFQMGLQYHFTMEPQTCVAVPYEQGLQVWSATQWMDHTQSVIAKMLKLKAAEVQLKVRRLGGGYGSKISRGNAVACAASLVAYKLNRPARFIQTIESMMNCNGKRWACRSDYEFHAKANGKIVGLKNVFYEDAGCTLNENPVTGHATLTVKNCYDFTADNYKVDGNAVKTDAPSSTWCRAPGSVEGVAMIENIVEHIAFEAQIDPADVRLINIKKDNKMAELLPRFLKSTEYRERRKEIDSYNEKNRWRKRGLGLAIMEYPCGYYGQFTATVSIYHADGSVVISHGGIEMGQGINTKAAQVAAYVLGIPLDYVRIESSDTINGANSTVSGGAVSSESVCFAVRKACNTLNERLKPVRESLKKEASWMDVVGEAWIRNINTIASDYHKEGDMKPYNIYGLALTEVEVDILTGNNLVTRVDILEDTGESISPYVDIGQVEGAFIMCLGYWLTEQMLFDRQTGQLVTNRTWTYKPPGAKDIPIDFRIELLQGVPNSGGFMRSKATGEPPCCLAVSSIFAIQHALQSARKDAGLKREWVRLGAPTTPETIVLNAGHDVNSFSLE